MKTSCKKEIAGLKRQLEEAQQLLKAQTQALQETSDRCKAVEQHNRDLHRSVAEQSDLRRNIVFKLDAARNRAVERRLDRDNAAAVALDLILTVVDVQGLLS